MMSVQNRSKLFVTMGVLGLSCLAVIVAAVAPIPSTPVEAAAVETAQGQPFTQLVKLENIDIRATQSFFKGEASYVSKRILAAMFDKQIGSWKGGNVGAKWTDDTKVGYRLALRKPTEIGSMTVHFGQKEPRGKFFALKPTAPYPGDVTNPDHWLPLFAHFEHGRYDIIAPPKTRTRAIYCEQTINRGYGNIGRWEIRRARLFNITKSAVAQGEWKSFGTSPTNLIEGKTWHNVGAHWESGEINRGPVSEVDPSFVVLNWSPSARPCAIRLRGNVRKFKLYAFKGGPKSNPALAPDEDWSRVVLDSVDEKVGQKGTTHHVGFKPRRTRAIKLVLQETKPANQRIISISELSVFTDVGDRPTPSFPEIDPNPAPVSFAYNLPADGMTAMVIETPDGKRVRNLFAQVDRKGGINSERWDLLNERRLMVTPGKYRYRGITGPPLELIYRHTPYPNIETYTKERLPWNYRNHDGYLANHTNHTAIGSAGDRLYVSTGGTEGGHSSMQADLNGVKQQGLGWGAHQNGLFNDGTNMYVHTGGSIYRCDKETNRLSQVFAVSNTPTRRGTIRGFAAHGDKIYVNHYSGTPYFQLATSSSNVDELNNFPRLPKEIPTREFYGIPSEPRADFVRLFRLGERIPGLIAPEGITHLPSTKSEHPRQFIVLSFKKPVPLGSLVFPTIAYKRMKKQKTAANADVRIDISVLKDDAPYPPQPGMRRHWKTVYRSPELKADTSPKRKRGTDAVKAAANGAAKKNGSSTDPSLARRASVPWDCIPLPENTLTRALRITLTDTTRDVDLFVADRKIENGTGPNLDDSLTKGVLGGKKDVLDLFSDQGAWVAELEGMRLLRRRFANIAPQARIRVSSGTVDPQTGIWDAQRKEFVSEKNPGIYALEWNEPRKLRGLALKEIGGAKTFVEFFDGPANASIDISGDEHWKRVATYRQKTRSGAHNSRSNNARAVYMDDCIDFGGEVETRAVRLRIVEPQPYGTIPKEGSQRAGAQASRCKVFGVAALEYIGGEVPINDDLLVRRLETRDAKTGELLNEVVSTVTGDIGVNPDGQLYGVQSPNIVKIDPKTGRTSAPVAPNLRIPGVMEFDHHGKLYVYDYDRARCNIQVYKPDTNPTRKRGVSATGNGSDPSLARRASVDAPDDSPLPATPFVYSHAVGKPGMPGAGLRDPAQMDDATSFTIDKEDNLWTVYPHVWPRRATHFKTDGTFVKEMLGNTMYGGGGTMDRYDKSRVYYKDMEFEVDVDGGTSRIKAFSTRDHNYSNPWFPYRFRDDLTAVMIDGRRYLVTTPLLMNPFQQAGWIHSVDEKTRAIKLIAGIGSPLSSDFFRTAEFTQHLGGKPLSAFRFIWADRNGDERPQPDEVKFTENKNNSWQCGRFSLDLSLATSAGYYRVKEFTDDGVPVYEEVVLPKGGGHVRLSNGNFFRMGDGHTLNAVGYNRVVTPEGEILWNYPAWNGVSGLWIPPWVPGQVGTQLTICGHETAHAGELGEFVVISCNTGQMNIFTTDGLLAGLVTYSARDPRRRGFPGTNENGTRMDFYSQGQEHFHTFFTKTEDDDRYFILTGGNHISIVEVRGFEKFQRFEGEFEITPEMVKETRAWAEARERKRNFVAAAVHDSYRVKRPPRIDGTIGSSEWPDAEVSFKREYKGILKSAFDAGNLYLAYTVTGAGPLANEGEDFERLFKTGGAVDIMLGTNSKADPTRSKPVAGDIRLLLTYNNKRPTAVLYRTFASGGSANPWSVTTPAGGTTSFADVRVLKGVRMATTGSSNYFTLEAAIPLRLLGLRPTSGSIIRMDWGVLSTFEGRQTIGRNYWSNRTAVGTTDEPTEARLTPDLWGYMRFNDGTPKFGPKLNDDSPLAKTGKKDLSLDDLLEELKGEK